MKSPNFYRTKRVTADNVFAVKHFSDELLYYLKGSEQLGFCSTVFVCIGTDRLTGDSLGPLIGYKINGIKCSNIFVHGNLERPIHAKNLYEEIEYIHSYYDKPYIIVIDACLGEQQQIGDIIIGEGPIKPGAGVKKNLTPVGNAYIMGVVNAGGFMEFSTLQNTRLNTVMRIADVIASGIKYATWKLSYDKERVINYIQ